MPKESKETEVWKKHREFNYEISNFGNVRRIGRKYLDKNGEEKTKTTRLLKPRLVNGFTSQVAFSKTEDHNTQISFFSVGRLVAEYFLDPPEDDQILLLHKDGNHANNQVQNLKWISRQEWNIIHKKMIKSRTILAAKNRQENKKALNKDLS